MPVGPPVPTPESPAIGVPALNMPIHSHQQTLVQRRLSYLVEDSKLYQGFHLEFTVKELINFERDGPAIIPSIENWEDVPVNSVIDSGPLIKPSSFQKDHRNPQSMVSPKTLWRG